jgi:hypothetical protein
MTIVYLLRVAPRVTVSVTRGSGARHRIGAEAKPARGLDRLNSFVETPRMLGEPR